MVGEKELKYGQQPGLRFACVLNGKGGCTDYDWTAVRSWTPDQGFLWVHLERDDPEAQSWLSEASGVDPVIAQVLLIPESRPRVERFDGGLLVFLRGVTLTEEGHSADLVPIHIWADSHRLISLRDKGLSLPALRDTRQALVAGRGPKSGGMLFVQIAEKVIRDVDPLLSDMEDAVDDLEDRMLSSTDRDWRVDLAEQRRRAVNLRRYIAPQREAMIRLQDEEPGWLTRRDRLHLREVMDRVMRYLESLDALRDRTTILHEDLTAKISEQIAKTSNRLTGLAALLLPPSLISGLLGVNIGGIPGQNWPGAFTILVVLLSVTVLLLWIILRRLKWLE